MADWYFVKNEQQCGPVPREKLPATSGRWPDRPPGFGMDQQHGRVVARRERSGVDSGRWGGPACGPGA